MILKNHLIEVFKKASLEKNLFLKENIVIKWVHRFGFDSLNDLLIHSPELKENQYEKENQEQIRIESLKISENPEETKCELSDLEITINNEVFSVNQDPNKITQYPKTQKLPLPYIKNLRKWINKDKKAS